MEKFNGDIRIKNDIWEALTKYRIPGEQMQCLLLIIRKTIGYNKEKDTISFSKFVEATGINKGNVGRALRELCKKKVVVKKDTNTGVSYRFNKKYTTWKSLSKKTTGSQKRQRLLSKKTLPPIINNKQKDSVYIKRANKVFNFYLEKTNPTLITKTGAIQNIKYYLKDEKYNTKKLMKAITNYSSVSGNHKKDPMNFFGVEGKDFKYFESYLQENFKQQKKKKTKISKKTKMTLDFPLSDKFREYAIRKEIAEKDIPSIFIEFKEYHEEKGESREKWILSWHTWICNKIEWNYSSNNKSNLKTAIGKSKREANLYEETNELTANV